jgi:hypothetical protein
MVAKFIYSAKKFERAAANPLYQSFQQLDENLVIGFAKQKTVNLARPYLTGFSVLEISKWHMYNIFYKHIRVLIPSASVAFSDTDSFLLTLPGKSVEEALEPINYLMDYSNLSPDHPLYSTSVKAHVGYLKEENEFKNQIVEACLIRSKCYSLRTVPRKPYQSSKIFLKNIDKLIKKTESKCKGTKKASVKEISFDDYKKVLYTPQNFIGTQTVIRSIAHKIYTIKQTRRFFQSFDDKNWIKRCQIHSYPYGHYAITTLPDPSYCDICHV